MGQAKTVRLHEMQNAMGIEFENHKIGINKRNFISLLSRCRGFDFYSPHQAHLLLRQGERIARKTVLECIKIDIFIKNILWFCFANTLQSAKDA
jgi:hypothetical protein